MDYVDHYKEYGYAVVKSVFRPEEIEALAEEFTRIKASALTRDLKLQDPRIITIVNDDPICGRVLRLVQWAVYISKVLSSWRVEPRLLEILAPLIGNSLKQAINTMFWKQPGSTIDHFSYHQDCRFRFASALRDLGASYVPVGIAVDPHRPENGAMKIYPGSHRLGQIALGIAGPVSQTALNDDDLREHSLEPSHLVDLVLDPGDVALWGPYTIHGSGPNKSAIDRRFYVNGYISAQNCDIGEWAFRNAHPCPLSRLT